MMMRSLAQVFVLTTFVATSLSAQIVTASATVASQVWAGGTYGGSTTLPAGTPLTNGLTVSASGGGTNGNSTVAIEFAVGATGNSVAYAISENLALSVSQFSVLCAAGTSTVPNETVWQLSSAQPVSGTLTAVFVETALPGGAGSTMIDIGNDGSFEWSVATTWPPAGTTTVTMQQQVTVNGTLEIRTRNTASLVGGAGNHSLTRSLHLTFEPTTASCTPINGSGVNPLACSCATLPILGSRWGIAVAPVANTVLTLVFASEVVAAPIQLPFGEVLLAGAAFEIPGNGVHSAALPNDPLLLGYALFVQGVRVNATAAGLVVELTDGQAAVLGF